MQLSDLKQALLVVIGSNRSALHQVSMIGAHRREALQSLLVEEDLLHESRIVLHYHLPTIIDRAYVQIF